MLKPRLSKKAFEDCFMDLFQYLKDVVETSHWVPTAIRRMLLKEKIMGAWEVTQWLRVLALQV